MSDHFATVTMMIEDLRSDDPEQRLHSVRGLSLIAQALGPDRTKAELLPFLTDYLDDNDEVLRALAKSLGSLLAEVGGFAHIQSLFTPLELLCSLDEITVREEAVASLNALAESIYKVESTATAPAQRDYVALVTRLSKAEAPQSRCSSCGLIAVPYKHSPESARAPLRQIFLRLCGDEELMVRRAANVAIAANLAEAYGSNCGELLNPFGQFCKDSNDSVRLQAVPSGIALMKQVSDSGLSQLVALFKTLSSDRSWRVRYMFADKIGDIVAGFGPNDVHRVFGPIFKSLCSDAEAEIRAATVFNMDRVLARSAEAGKKDVLLAGLDTASDTNAHVKMSLAATILKSASHCDKDLWASKGLPVATSLLGDADADVRLAIISGFSALPADSAASIAPKLVPVVLSLAEDPKWRIRETVVLQIPALVSNLGKSADSMLDLCIKLLQDRVSSIRQAAGRASQQLIAQSGSQFAVAKFFPRIQVLLQSQNYLHRVAYVQTLQAVAGTLDFPTVQSHVISSLLALSSDKVANVRLAVAKCVNVLRRDARIGAQFSRAAEVAAMQSRLEGDAAEDVALAMRNAHMIL